ncbi:SMI1/KNR4 family protein [Ralstonia syzygii]|uniref:SMI1/KNR4 family protein n=1 Tax=Ralstonia syzygii TaxID=28097 RepID=A0ABX7ZF08_9RALS|nr:SMI1/KNR4 family protein [Ralstonia syzygii]QUP53639.1 SMI1/KNR4 family protein [Ralstonia syzygii]
MNRINDILEILNSSVPLGEEITPNGARLIGLVKDEQLGIRRWWHFIFPGLTEDQVSDLEKAVGIPFPAVFSEYLKDMNGLTAFSGALCIYGARLSLDRRSKDAFPYALQTPNSVERPKDASPDMFFIGGYNWDGSKIYMDLQTGRVFRCSRESAKPLNEWPDFWSMLISEISRISALYESDGRKKNLSEPTAPISG